MDYDVIVIGCGPGGSIAAMMLAARGRSVAVIDRDTFPRFAIGESSTPIASRTLEQIAADFDLPELLPLTRWDRMRDTAGLMGGIKRGFTYFDHSDMTNCGPLFGESTSRDTIDLENAFPHDSGRRLMVAASPSDEVSDTHWLRSEVDAYLANVCHDRGVDLRLGWSLEAIEHASPWQVRVRCVRDPSISESLRSPVLIDASGRHGAAVRHLGYRDRTATMRTRSSARWTHLECVPPIHFTDDDLPYRPDAAAVHHLVGDGWIWQLPFRDSRVSVGRVCIGNSGIVRAAKPSSNRPVDHLDIRDCPGLEKYFRNSRLSDQPGGWRSADRVQHRWFGGKQTTSMLALPTTLATIDPLHSTGLAHAVTGAQRVVDLVLRQSESDVARYQDQVDAEIDLIDRVVSLAYHVFRRTDLFFASCMLYFALAIADEEQRQSRGYALEHATWQADRPQILLVVTEVERMLQRDFAESSQGVNNPVSRRRSVDDELSELLSKICEVPLACRADNLYRYTFA